MSRLKLAAGVVISAVLIGVLLWTVDLRELAASLKRTRWEWTLLSVACALAGLWIRARRWRYLFPPGSDPPALVPAVMIGYMVNNLLPLRAGEIVRVYVVARRWRRGFWTALATLVVERVLDSLAIVLILGVLVLLIPVPAVFRWTAVTLLAVDVLAVAALAFLAAAPATGRRLLTALTRRWPGLGERLTRVFDRFVLGLAGVRTPAHLLPLLAWSALVWVAPALAAWTMLRALDLDLPLVVGWTVLAFVGMGISIPSAPGYVGVFHYAAVLALEVFGVPRPAALGYAILFHATQFIAVTIVGWIYLLREQLTLGEATHARPAEEAGSG
ncbi:MAG: lysylphosphatidylglycerol synthase transmembrane domain-containing protein [Candidatus Rokuibacteriota bacterium]